MGPGGPQAPVIHRRTSRDRRGRDRPDRGGCGGGGSPAADPPPASAHTAAEQAAVTNWLVKTNQMWTHDDFAAVDQVTTGQMRTIYLAEEPQASLPRTRTGWGSS